ncbi:MAG: ABC transporter ATP-binding protein, partial [Lachnospiraceae bacterium]|nr:ABC transporter ATP-binding protein [Lachnospiraceae bacterium]
MSVLLVLLKRNKFFVAFSVFTAIVSNLSQMFFAYFIGKLVNNIESRSSVSLSFILTVACLMASNAFTLLLNQYMGRLTAEKMAHSLRMGYAKSLLARSIKDKDSCDTASAMSKAQNELAQANSYLGNTFFDITGMLFMAILATVFLLFQNVLLTLVILVPTLLILVYVFFSSKRLSGIVSNAQNEKNRMNKVAYSIIHAFYSVKIFGGEVLCMKAYVESFYSWKKEWQTMGRRSALYNTLSG